MSQCSGTTTSESEPFWLGYPTEGWNNSYYTAHVAPGIGVTVCKMLSVWMVQFFPWNEAHDGVSGHSKYVDFITHKAHSMIKEGVCPFDRWPYLQTGDSNVLILKCLIEDGVKQIGELDARN